jgi:SAM-dependent methyltransferase
VDADGFSVSGPACPRRRGSTDATSIRRSTGVGHLNFAEVAVNEIAPPLPYPALSFDFVYGLSVFTHLSEELQHAWMRECQRVLKPEGYLLVSTMGEYYAGLRRLTDSEREAFRNGQVIVLYEGSVGTNLCTVYHPREYVDGTLAAELEPVLFRPAIFGRQDICLFANRRSPSSRQAHLTSVADAVERTTRAGPELPAILGPKQHLQPLSH